MKKNILLMIVTAIIFTGIGVFATIGYQADEIGYGTGTVKDAIDDLYNRIDGISIYPGQKITVYKETNGRIYTLTVYDDNDTKVFETTYDCDVWGVFSTSTKTYTYKGKEYTLIAQGVNDINNLRGEIYDGSIKVFSFNSSSIRDNGSWETDSTINLASRILYNNNVYMLFE